MKRNLVLLVLLLLAPSLWADEIAVSLLQAGGSKKKEYRSAMRGVEQLALVVENLTKEQITITHIGLGHTSVLVKIEERTIKPQGEGAVPVALDNESLGIPSGVEVAIGYQAKGEFKIAQAVLSIGTDDLMTFTPGFLTWKVGEAPIEKSVRVNLPPKTRVRRIPEVPGFSVRMDGDAIFVKPLGTAKVTSAGVMLETAPASIAKRRIPLGLAVTE